MWWLILTWNEGITAEIWIKQRERKERKGDGGVKRRGKNEGSKEEKMTGYERRTLIPYAFHLLSLHQIVHFLHASKWLDWVNIWRENIYILCYRLSQWSSTTLTDPRPTGKMSAKWYYFDFHVLWHFQSKRHEKMKVNLAFIMLVVVRIAVVQKWIVIQNVWTWIWLRFISSWLLYV